MTIQISIRHFATVREIVGIGEETRDVPDGTTAGDVLAALAREHPELGKLGSSAMVMVNHTYAKLDTPLHDGDELAFIPPSFRRVGRPPICGYVRRDRCARNGGTRPPHQLRRRSHVHWRSARFCPWRIGHSA